VRPQSVISCGNAQAGGEVKGYSPYGSLELERNPEGLDAAIEWNAENEGDIEPIYMLVPVCACDGRFSDVWLLRVVFGVAVGF